jgi:hypothetical protein
MMASAIPVGLPQLSRDPLTSTPEAGPALATEAPPVDPLASDRAARSRLRLQSSGWGALAAASAGLIAAALALSDAAASPLEAGLRAAGCGFFYGLLAFHLQRVDPDDGHLQAGLVGALCGIRSLSAQGPQAPLAPSLMMECARIWLPLWMPLIGSALMVYGFQRLLAARHRSTLAVPRP